MKEEVAEDTCKPTLATSLIVAEIAQVALVWVSAMERESCTSPVPAKETAATDGANVPDTPGFAMYIQLTLYWPYANPTVLLRMIVNPTCDS